MTAQGFDYKTFVQNLTQQAQEIVPQEFDDNQKGYVVNTLFNFANVAGQALAEDPSLEFSAEQAQMITQIIAEWSFHKSVDLIRSGIPQQYWDPVMQKIAYVIFEIAKQTFSQNLPQDQILDVIQHHVDKTYKECIEELKQKNLITGELADVAEHESNIDQMMQDAATQQEAQAAQGEPPATQSGVNIDAATAATVPLGAGGKTLKLATLALLFKRMKQDRVQTMLDKFQTDDANSVIKFMNVPDLESKVDTNIALKCLQEIRTNLPTQLGTLTPARLVAKMQSIAQYIDRPRLEQMLQNERPKVKRFVFNAIDGEFYSISPKVANIIAHHIELSV